MALERYVMLEEEYDLFEEIYNAALAKDWDQMLHLSNHRTTPRQVAFWNKMFFGPVYSPVQQLLSEEHTEQAKHLIYNFDASSCKALLYAAYHGRADILERLNDLHIQHETIAYALKGDHPELLDLIYLNIEKNQYRSLDHYIEFTVGSLKDLGYLSGNEKNSLSFITDIKAEKLRIEIIKELQKEKALKNPIRKLFSWLPPSRLFIGSDIEHKVAMLDKVMKREKLTFDHAHAYLSLTPGARRFCGLAKNLMGHELNGKTFPAEVVAMILEYLVKLPLNEALIISDAVNRHLCELTKTDIVKKYQVRAPSSTFFLPGNTFRHLEEQQKRAFKEAISAANERCENRLFLSAS